MNQKTKNIIQLCLYVLLPIVLMVPFRYIYFSTYSGSFGNGMALISCLYVANALGMLYVANIKIEGMDKTLFILDIISTVVYGSFFIVVLVPTLTIFYPLANLFYISSMLSNFWFACFLYRLIIRGIKYYTKKDIEQV